MTRVGLAWRSLRGSAFRSGVVFACTLLVAGFSLSTALVLRGAEDSLRLAVDRLGADVVVVPAGAEERVQAALLTGKPVQAWMPLLYLHQVEQVPGVARASPQRYLASLSRASCCSLSEAFIVGYDPASDFTVTPWLERELGGALRLGDAIGGAEVHLPEGEDTIRLYTYPLQLRGNLAPTGTGLDQTLFITFQTADELALVSHRAEQPLTLPPHSISAVLVQVRPEETPAAVAARIGRAIPGVAAVESPRMFQRVRGQLAGVLRVTLTLLGLTLLLCLALVALVFSMAANERRRELAVLRALGATRGFVFQSLLVEALLLAASGAAAGIGLAALATRLYRDLLVRSLGIPFLLPSLPAFAGLVAGALALALAGVALAAGIPALRASRQEPALAMRE